MLNLNSRFSSRPSILSSFLLSLIKDTVVVVLQRLCCFGASPGAQECVMNAPAYLRHQAALQLLKPSDASSVRVILTVLTVMDLRSLFALFLIALCFDHPVLAIQNDLLVTTVTIWLTRKGSNCTSRYLSFTRHSGDS